MSSEEMKKKNNNNNNTFLVYRNKKTYLNNNKNSPPQWVPNQSNSRRLSVPAMPAKTSNHPLPRQADTNPSYIWRT